MKLGLYFAILNISVAFAITVYCVRHDTIFGHSSFLFQVVVFVAMIEITRMIVPRILKYETEQFYLEALSEYYSK